MCFFVTKCRISSLHNNLGCLQGQAANHLGGLGPLWPPHKWFVAWPCRPPKPLWSSPLLFFFFCVCEILPANWALRSGPAPKKTPDYHILYMCKKSIYIYIYIYISNCLRPTRHRALLCFSARVREAKCMLGMHTTQAMLTCRGLIQSVLLFILYPEWSKQVLWFNAWSKRMGCVFCSMHRSTTKGDEHETFTKLQTCKRGTQCRSLDIGLGGAGRNSGTI